MALSLDLYIHNQTKFFLNNEYQIYTFTQINGFKATISAGAEQSLQSPATEIKTITDAINKKVIQMAFNSILKENELYLHINNIINTTNIIKKYFNLSSPYIICFL